MNISVALQGRSCTLAQLRVLRSDDQASLPWGRGGGVPWVPLQPCPVTHLPSGPTHSTPGIIRADKELGALRRRELEWMKLVGMRAAWKGPWSGLVPPLVSV